jgi:hypothetical protein
MREPNPVHPNHRRATFFGNLRRRSACGRALRSTTTTTWWRREKRACANGRRRTRASRPSKNSSRRCLASTSTAATSPWSTRRSRPPLSGRPPGWTSVCRHPRNSLALPRRASAPRVLIRDVCARLFRRVRAPARCAVRPMDDEDESEEPNAKAPKNPFVDDSESSTDDESGKAPPMTKAELNTRRTARREARRASGERHAVACGERRARGGLCGAESSARGVVTCHEPATHARTRVRSVATLDLRCAAHAGSRVQPGLCAHDACHCPQLRPRA